MDKTQHRIGRRREPLSVRLKKAREARGWSIHHACRKTRTLGRQSLINLEAGITPPERVIASTAIQLMELYYPDVQLEDFYEHWDKKTLGIKLVRKERSRIAHEADRELDGIAEELAEDDAGDGFFDRPENDGILR